MTNNHKAYVFCLVLDCRCNSKNGDENVWLQQCGATWCCEL